MLRQIEQMSFKGKPFTVVAVFYDGSGKLISHCFAGSVRSAREEVLIKTGGAVFIVAVFEGHLIEAEREPYYVEDSIAQIETAGISSEMK